MFWGYYRFPALEAGSRKNYLSVMTALAFLSISLGIVLEILQYYVIPNRDFDLWDVVADAAGAVLAVLILWRLYAKLKKKI